jgi:Inner membrane component of T3SS, cytoplasmic domain/YscD/CdsD-like Bon-like domain 3
MAATGLMSSFTAWLSAIDSSSPSTFVLECTDGFHRGVHLELEPGNFRIGSTAGADIVLRDAGIAAEHAILRVGPRSIDLHAVGGDVVVGEETVAKGFGCALQAPADLKIGEARLRISAEQAQAPADAPAKPADAPARSRISPGILFVAGALLLAVPAMRPAAPKASDLPQIDAPENLKSAATKLLNDLPAADRQFVQNCLASKPGISVREAIAQLSGCNRQPQANAGPALAANAGAAVNAEDAGRKLAEHLTASGLSGLRVSAAGGQVAVNGSITKQQGDAWTEAQQWFDAAFRRRVVLVANVTPTDAKKPTPVMNAQAVWFGDRPYVITVEGNRYYKGAFLDNGWTIKDIADGRILLAKDGEPWRWSFVSKVRAERTDRLG